MCAEKEPLECHRGLLVAPALQARGVSVAHIVFLGSELGGRSNDPACYDNGRISGEVAMAATRRELKHLSDAGDV